MDRITFLSFSNVQYFINKETAFTYKFVVDMYIRIRQTSIRKPPSANIDYHANALV